jgi:hypothetical protein
MTNAVVSSKKIETLEQAVALAQEIERAEAAVKAMKAQLKEYVAENGPVETDDKVWEIAPVVSWSFNSLKELATQMVLEGHNPWELLSLPASSLAKLGWSEDVLSKFGQKKETKRFSSHKK